MAKLTCTSCGADYPRDWRRAWGRHPDTHGKGPVMVCSALVPNGLIAPVPDDQDPVPAEAIRVHSHFGAAGITGARPILSILNPLVPIVRRRQHLSS